MNKSFIGKKLLSLMLSVLMCLSLIPTVAFATTAEGENYLQIKGFAGFENTKFDSFAKAYETIKPKMEELCGLGQEVATAEAFDAMFTDRDENGNATITYTVHGTLTYDETSYSHLLTMGRKSSHYGNERHLINFKFVGANNNRTDTLAVNSDITLPYEWWGEKTVTAISFEGLTLTGSAPSGIYASQPYFEGIDFKIDNCTLKGIKVYNCSNVGGSYTITNSTFDGTGTAEKAYAIHLQGNDTAPLSINISDNIISGYDRGINIDQATAVAVITGNTISVKENGRSCIQFTQLAKATASGNTLNLNGGNAFTFHSNLAAGSAINITGNIITGNGYLAYDDTKNSINLTYSGNSVASTVDTTKGIYGGTTKDLSTAVNEVINNKSNFVAKIGDTEYKTLQAAIDAAGRRQTVTLVSDTKENVTIANQLTLDLNGYTLNGGTVKGKPALTVTARVTVKDSGTARTGTIMREDTAENSGVSSHYVIDVQGAGWLTFEGGNVKNDSGNSKGKGASLVRIGDDSVAKYPGLNIKGGTFTQDNFIAIKVDRGDLFLNGGTINSANSYAIENWFRATVKGGTVNGDAASWTYSGGANSTLEITGGTINGNVTSVNYGNAEDKKATVKITGGTVNGELDTRSYDPTTGELTAIDDAKKAAIEVTGGTFTNDPTAYLVESSSITKENGKYSVAKAYLAKVGNTQYYTMDEAFKAQTASGEEIVLLRDYKTAGTFSSGSIKRTVDLNGHTWTYTGTGINYAAFEINYSDATLTVKNGKVISNTLVGLIPSALGGTITYDNSTLIFENVEMISNGNSGFETNGSNTNDTVTLKNSTLNVPNGYGIYFPSSGALNIENSKITAKTMGVQVCAGSLNISGDSVINVTGDPVAKTENDGAIQDGAAISIVNRPGYKGLANVTITGGTFKSAKGEALKAYTWENKTESEFGKSNVITVSGGTFSNEIPRDYCAAGLTSSKNSDGTYTVKDITYVAEVGGVKYETVNAAIAAANNGDTVTLLSDTTEDVLINKSITLDLGGKTLTNTGVGKATISITVNNVTVKNGNVIGGASYYNIEVKKGASATLEDVTATAGNTGSSMVDNWGTLTIKSGSYTGGLNTVKSEEGSKLTITGGKFVSDYAPKYNITGTILVYGDTIITGGEFIQNSTSTAARVVVTGIVEGYTAKTVITGGNFTNRSSGAIFHGLGKATSANFEVSGGTFNKKISDGYCANGYIPTKNADGTYGVKEGAYVAAIGSTGYETLADAIKAAKSGKTIKLLANCYSDRINLENKNITLVLNGYTVTSTAAYGVLFCVKNGKTITIDGTVAGSKVVGTIMITGDTYGHIAINGGTYENAQYCPIYVNGAVSNDESTVTITNAVITALNGDSDQDNGVAVYLAGYATSKFTNCTISAPVTGIEIRAGKLDLINCDVTGGSGEIMTSANGNGTTVTNVAVAVSQHTTKKAIELNITGGTYTGTAAVYQTNVQGTGSDGVKVNISSGTFNGLVKAETTNVMAISGGTFDRAVIKDYCANEFAPVKNEDGKYEVIKLNVIKQLKLGNDLTMSYSVDSEGYTVSHVTFSIYDATLNNNQGGYTAPKTVYIKDGSFDFTGINPQRMVDTIKAVVYLVKDGKTYTYIVEDYSVKDYCLSLLNDPNYNVKWSEIISNLLVYGAEAQKYMNYRTDTLVTDYFKDCAAFKKVSHEDKMDSAIRYNEAVGGNGDITISSKLLVLDNAVNVRVYFNLKDGIDINNVKFTAAVIQGNEEKHPEEFTSFKQDANGYYFEYTGVMATELDNKIIFKSTINDAENVILNYNVNSYLVWAKNDAKLGALVKALFSYGYTCDHFAS